MIGNRFTKLKPHRLDKLYFGAKKAVIETLSSLIIYEEYITKFIFTKLLNKKFVIELQFINFL